MVAPKRARYLRYVAPIALVATLSGTFLIVQGGLSPKPAAHHAKKAARAHGKYANATFYTVQPGDSLTSIAARTGIPLTTLETLNPKVDPNALQTGQRLRLRR
jgi:LysM repeat protein